MGPIRIVGIILIALGVAAVSLGGFSFTRESEKAHIGPLKLTVQEKHEVGIPMWLGLGTAIAGVVLVVVGGRKR